MALVFSSLSCLELKYSRLSLVGFQQKLMPGKLTVYMIALIKLSFV